MHGFAHVVGQIFSRRAEAYVDGLCQLVGAKWHWYRMEFQSRGSVHAHGLLCPGTGDLGNLTRAVYFGRRARRMLAAHDWTGAGDSNDGEEDGDRWVESLADLMPEARRLARWEVDELVEEVQSGEKACKALKRLHAFLVQATQPSPPRDAHLDLREATPKAGLPSTEKT